MLYGHYDTSFSKIGFEEREKEKDSKLEKENACEGKGFKIGVCSKGEERGP